jgi:hypothetical protein
MARQLHLDHQGAVCCHLVSRDNAIEHQTKDSCGLLRSNHPCDREAGS